MREFVIVFTGGSFKRIEADDWTQRDNLIFFEDIETNRNIAVLNMDNIVCFVEARK